MYGALMTTRRVISRTWRYGATFVLVMETKHFHLVLSTDGDVSQTEIADVLDALGYHGIMVLDLSQDHEHPCPSSECIEQLRTEGHLIPDGTDCCVCWAENS